MVWPNERPMASPENPDQCIDKLDDKNYLYLLSSLSAEAFSCLISRSAELRAKFLGLDLGDLSRFGISITVAFCEDSRLSEEVRDRLYYSLFSAQRYSECAESLLSVLHDGVISDSGFKLLAWSLLCSGRHEDVRALNDRYNDSVQRLGLGHHILLSDRISQAGVNQVKDASGSVIASFFATSFNASSMNTSLLHQAGMFAEIPELQAIMNIVRGRNALDIGCLIGNHSVFLAKFCGCTVTAIDSDPRCCAQTELNLLLNQVPPERFTVQCKAAFDGRSNSDFEGDDVMFLDGDTEPYGFVKVDIDGGELQFLKRSHDYIKKHRPIIFCEISSNNRPIVLDMFSRLAYTARKLTERPDMAGDDNYLLIP